MRKIDRLRHDDALKRKVARTAKLASRAAAKAERDHERGQDRVEPAEYVPRVQVDGRACAIHPEQVPLVRAALASYERFFGRDWLSKAETHPARELWGRTDEAATGEVVMWGHVFDRVQQAAKSATLERWKREARTSDTNNLYSALFEVFAAALFYDEKTRPINDAGPQLHGFDLSLDLGSSKVLQVSLKNLRPSEYERKLRAFAEALRDDLKQRLPASARRMIRIFVPKSIQPQFLAEERAALGEAIVAAHAADKHRAQVGPWSALLDGLEPINGHAFALVGPSFTVIVASEHAPNESQRLSSNGISVACAKFRDHCANAGPNVANIFFIKVPPSVNIDDARAAIREAFASEANACISAGILYRASWLTRNAGHTFYIGHEIYEEKNPLAAVPLDAVCPKMSLPIPFGESQHTVPTRELRIDEDLYVLDGEHAALAGSHVYQGPFLDLVAKHGIEIIWDRDGQRTVEHPGHDDRLVLL